MSWKVGKEQSNHIQCSLCKPPTIYLEPVPRNKIELLMDAYPHQEWLAYMVGKHKKENFFVEDIVVPPHASVSSGSAEALPFHQPKNCLGVIHSHHTMGAFHSGTDHDYVDQNFPISVTVAKNSSSLGYDAVSYLITPCGKTTVGKSSIKYVQPRPLFDANIFLEKAKENIDKGRQITVQVTRISPGNVPFCGAEQPYVPIRYRTFGDNKDKEDISYFIGKNEIVLSQKELEQILKEADKGV